MKKVFQTFPVSAGLLEPQHVNAIDPRSPWPIYLWFIEHVTRDEPDGEGNFDGIVLNGRPVSMRQIADDLGIGERACRRHLARLVPRYVVQKKTGVGSCTYTVKNSKRWAYKRHPRTDRSGTSKAPELQASLFSPPQDGSNDATHQKPASGSLDPQAGNRPQGTDPQAGKWSDLTKNRPQQKDGSRAQSHNHKDLKLTGGTVGEIRSLEDQQPPSLTEHENRNPQPRESGVPELARKVIKFLSLTMTSPIIRAIEAAILAEADFRGCSNVEAAEFITHEALRDRQQGIAIDSWYFVETKWRNRSKSSAAAPRPVYGEACEEMQRQQAASR